MLHASHASHTSRVCMYMCFSMSPTLIFLDRIFEKSKNLMGTGIILVDWYPISQNLTFHELRVRQIRVSVDTQAAKALYRAHSRPFYRLISQSDSSAQKYKCRRVSESYLPLERQRPGQLQDT